MVTCCKFLLIVGGRGSGRMHEKRIDGRTGQLLKEFLELGSARHASRMARAGARGRLWPAETLRMDERVRAGKAVAKPRRVDGLSTVDKSPGNLTAWTSRRP